MDRIELGPHRRSGGPNLDKKGRKMRFLAFWLVVWLVMLTTFFGCDELLRRGDKAADTTKDLAGSADEFLRTPTGQALPGQVKLYAAGGIALASILANGWQEWRNKGMKKVTKAIVQGIESHSAAEAAGPDGPGANPVGAVKAAIGDQMKAAGCYDRGKKIVNQLKLSSA